MNQNERNIATLRRCQLYHDNMGPPEYTEDESGWRRDEDGELYYYEKEEGE